ncbi:serine/threonine protein phosphatase domain protein, partial [Ostertagia ostertagi]
YVSDFLESNFAKSIRDRLVKHGARWKHGAEGALELNDSVEEMIITEIHRLDDTISRFNPDCTSLTGSTMIAAIMEGNRYLSVVNVGDSRAVACDSENRLVALSKDHKPDDPNERRRIENAGGFVCLNEGTFRVQGILAVSR